MKKEMLIDGLRQKRTILIEIQKSLKQSLINYMGRFQ
jgi:hypothetical protein